MARRCTSTTPGATRASTPAGRSSGSATTSCSLTPARSPRRTRGMPGGSTPRCWTRWSQPYPRPGCPTIRWRAMRQPSGGPTCTTWNGGWSSHVRSWRRRIVPGSPPNAFQYAIVRVLPRVERGESLNVGVVLLCRPRRYLAARIALDERRLAAFAPDLALAPIPPHLAAIERIAAGEPAAAPIARLGQAEGFHWLVSPSSTIIQASEVHSGLCDDPAAELGHLVATLVQ